MIWGGIPLCLTPHLCVWITLPRLWGGSDRCSLSWPLFPLPTVMSRSLATKSHFSDSGVIGAVSHSSLELCLAQRTRQGDFEVTLGTMQVINEGCFLHLSKAELLWKGLVITVSSYVSDQPRISLYLVRTICLPQSSSMSLGLTQLESKVNMLWSYLK